ncbi:MAG: hypothetical protein AB7I19_09250 [Planctomycetota bacterium]
MNAPNTSTRIVPPDRDAIRAALELTSDRRASGARRGGRRGLVLLGAMLVGVWAAAGGPEVAKSPQAARLVTAGAESVQVVRVTADGALARQPNRRDQRAVVRLRLAASRAAVDADAALGAVQAWLGECSSHTLLEAAAGADIELRERLATALRLASPAELELDWESLELR